MKAANVLRRYFVSYHNGKLLASELLGFLGYITKRYSLNCGITKLLRYLLGNFLIICTTETLTELPALISKRLTFIVGNLVEGPMLEYS